MGYRAERQRKERDWKKFKRVLFVVVAVIVVAVCAFAVFVPPESWKYYFGKPKVDKISDGELRIHFLDVGQGDATLIELPDGRVMLIDGGNDYSSSKKSVMRYLNELHIKEIDHLLVTHTDADHCGGLDEVFRYKKVLNAYLPPSFDSSAAEYAEVYEAAVTEEDCTVWTSSREINLSNAEGAYPYTLTFLYPYAESVGSVALSGGNESSAVVWLDYFGSSALFCGDATEEVELALLRDERLGLFGGRGIRLDGTEILKVAHHGSKSSSSAEFLSQLGVKTAVISCGKNNAYGHPSEEVLKRLSTVGAQTWRTDLEGHILLTATPDGSYRIDCIGK